LPNACHETPQERAHWGERRALRDALVERTETNSFGTTNLLVIRRDSTGRPSFVKRFSPPDGSSLHSRCSSRTVGDSGHGCRIRSRRARAGVAAQPRRRKRGRRANPRWVDGQAEPSYISTPTASLRARRCHPRAGRPLVGVPSGGRRLDVIENGSDADALRAAEALNIDPRNSRARRRPGGLGKAPPRRPPASRSRIWDGPRGSRTSSPRRCKSTSDEAAFSCAGGSE
jgi:hypothetical protein